ncbi:hypothetical protein Tco_0725266 [Tanacetum coccineum]|uniref:Uncharacterized protein n=1 Tax=Tanacetum coccineum TaxID=301880 RepID=A0ABQ4YEK9_9ASTR
MADMLFHLDQNEIRDAENESRIRTLETDHANEGNALQGNINVSDIEYYRDAVENDNVVESSMNQFDMTNELSQSSRNESINVESDMDHGSGSDDGSGSQNGSDRDHGSGSDAGSGSQNGFDNDDDSDSQDSNFLFDPDNMIDDVEVDMPEFRTNIDDNVEWVGSKEIVKVVEEGSEDEEVDHKYFDSGSDSEYEGERKKALNMFNKINKANAPSSGFGANER